MSEIKKIIPNLLTISRIILTCILNIYISIQFGKILVPIVITLIIFATDYFDGKIARYLNSATRIGAIIDVTSDFLYITITYYILHTFNVVPIWFLFIIVMKFIEFIITSFILKRLRNNVESFVFDSLGRFTSCSFYVIPIFSYYLYNISKNNLYIYMYGILCIISILVLISSFYRINECIKVVLQKQVIKKNVM